MSLIPPEPIIYLITKGEATDSDFTDACSAVLETIRLAVETQVSLVQIREKHLSARLLFELTRSAAEITRGSATRLLVNDRADIAIAAGADGVHLAADSIPTGALRQKLLPGFLIGVSTHSHEAVRTAAKAGADFAVFGPIFQTPGKGRPRGLADLRALCAKTGPFAVIGIGGIDPANCGSVLASGASGIAGIRSFNEPESLRSISRLMSK